MRFSIVIPVAPYRGAEIIESLKEQDYPKSEYHVVVVKGKNPSENRNRGSTNAKGEIIGFLDDDAVIDRDFLSNVDAFFKRYPKVDIVGGPQLTPKDDTGFAKISGYALGSKFGASTSSKRYVKGEVDLNADEKLLTSANLFVKKHVMEKVQFDKKLFPGEDPKFINDAKKLGFKIAYSPDFYIYHRRRPTIRQLVKQIFNYGKVRPKKESIIETIKKPVFIMPSLFVIYLFGLLLISSLDLFNIINVEWMGDTLWGIILVPLILYVILALFFSVYESLKNQDPKALLVLPIIFPMIHLSYGIGMIWGLIKK